MWVKWHERRANIKRGRNGFWKTAGLAVLVLSMGAMVEAAPIVISGPDQVDDLNMRSGWTIGGDFTSQYLGFNGTYIYRSALRFNVADNPLLAGMTASQIGKAEIVITAKAVSVSTVNGVYELYRLRRQFQEADFVTNGPHQSSGVTSWTYFEGSGEDQDGNTTYTNAADQWTLPGASDTTHDRFSAVDASFMGPASKSDQTLRIDVTQYVKDVLNGAPDLGWIIQSADETASPYMIFHSSESSTAGPSLEITTVPEPASMSLLIVGGLLAMRRRRS